MSIRRRLMMFFVLIVMLPTIVAGGVVQRVVIGEEKKRVQLALQPALTSVLSYYEGRAPLVEAMVRATAGSPGGLERLIAGGTGAEIRRFLEKRLRGDAGDVDFLLALDKQGRPRSFATEPAVFADSFATPGQSDILKVATRGGQGIRFSPGFVTTSVDPALSRQAQVVGGFWMDGELLEEISVKGVEVSLVGDGKVIASTARDPAPVPSDVDSRPSGPVDVSDAEAAQATRLSGDMTLVAYAPSKPIDELSRDLLFYGLGLLLLALVLMIGLGQLLASVIVGPLDELAEGANAIAQGRFDHRIPVRSRDEVGRLATAFNDMADRLKDTITQLSSSRDHLRRAVRRVGETLRSTHDMRQILESILNTATDAAEADAGVLWTFTSTRAEVYPVIGVGVDIEALKRIRVGQGIVGLVAERGTAAVIQPGARNPRPSGFEPDYPVALLIPFYSEDRVSGVIGLYRSSENPFTQEDLDTVVFLAEQGGVAIENVFLHDEAQRLSITDGLTGVWNRRYFQMQFRQVLATSLRFHRSFSVLMLDIDDFKEVNDAYGHQRGDAVLIEFAQRVSRTVREVDTFARYGGEEFICMLSETDAQGAFTTAQKICEVVRAERFGGVGEEPTKVTVSIGVAAYPEHADSYKDLVEAADGALFEAKRAGKDRVRVAGKPSPDLKLAK